MNSEDARIVTGLATQAIAREQALSGGADHVGWKAGLGTAAAMAAVGTTAPLVGFLTARTRHEDGEAVAIGGWAKPVLEPEVAVRLGADLPAGASRDDALAAIAAVGPAIELVDLGPVDDVEAVLAGNIFHRAFWLGPLRDVGGTLGAVRLDVEVDGATHAAEIDPTELLGDLAEIVRALGDQLPLADAALRAGDVIITGSALPTISLTAGQRHVTVTLAGAGAVTARFG